MKFTVQHSYKFFFNFTGENIIYTLYFINIVLYFPTLYFHLYVNVSGSNTSVGEERELICLLLFTCIYVVSVWRGFLFLCALGMGYVIIGTPCA